MMRACATALLTLASVLAVSAYCSAQKTATLTGTVQDASGAIVREASVVLIDEASKARRTTTSNAEGYFTFSAVQTGTYDVEIQAKGFAIWKAVGVQIDPGDQRSIPNIRLAVGSIKEEVIVNSEGVGVETTSPEKSELINAEEIKRLSTQGRDASELVRFLPGFAVTQGGGIQNGTDYDPSVVGFGSTALPGYSANGSTPQTGSVSVVQDGVNVVDPGDMGASTTNLNMDMVEEVKVETSNFSADSSKGPIVVERPITVRRICMLATTR
jgi:hypothetical protein